MSLINCSACEFPATTDFVVALNSLQWEAKANCGSCVEIKGSRGIQVARVVDLCPECAYGDLDMSKELFPLIDSVEKGRVKVEWKWTPCP